MDVLTLSFDSFLLLCWFFLLSLSLFLFFLFFFFVHSMVVWHVFKAVVPPSLPPVLCRRTLLRCVTLLWCYPILFIFDKCLPQHRHPDIIFLVLFFSLLCLFFSSSLFPSSFFLFFFLFTESGGGGICSKQWFRHLYQLYSVGEHC